MINLYRTVIAIDSNVFGVVDTDNKTDFESNYKQTSLQIDEYNTNDTTFVVSVNYNDFVTEVDINWENVRYLNRISFYELLYPKDVVV